MSHSENRINLDHLKKFIFIILYVCRLYFVCCWDKNRATLTTTKQVSNIGSENSELRIKNKINSL